MLNPKTETLSLTPSETIIFDEDGIKITNLRFMVKDQTYAMSGITSVRSHRVKYSLVLPLFLLLSGVIALLIESYFLGWSWITLGLVAFYVRVGKYGVSLGTAGGEVQSYVSRDKSFIERVVRALNDAIIMRG